MKESLRELGIDVRVSRGEAKTVCPKCSSSRKNKKDLCLSVNVTDGIWNCHHCGWAGSVNKMKPKKEYTLPQVTITNVSSSMLKWFSTRGISNNTLLRYKVSEGNEYMPQVGANRNVIQFNYCYKDVIVNVKFRDAQKNFKLVSGAQLIPYGVDVALDNSNDIIAIVEGEMDVLSCYEAGINYAVSVPNGASKGNQKLEWLDECYDLFEGKTIYLATDMDEAGQSLRAELSRRFGKSNCMVVDLPRKDANEVLLEDGADALANCFRNATPYPIEGVEDASSVVDELVSLHENGVPKGCAIGYEMDQDFKWFDGQVTLITGIPAHGKSTFLKNIMYRLASMHDWKFLIYSAEEASTAFALTDMYSIAYNKSFFQTINSPRITKDEILRGKDFMSDHFKYYKLDNDLSVDAIISKAEEMVKRHGIRGLVIDNMSTVEKIMSNQSDTRHHQIKNMLNDISRFSRNFGVHVFLVAHPKKMSDGAGNQYKIPQGYDVGDSSHWFNLPDNGMTVYRNFDSGQTEIHKWKVRFRYTGKNGVDYFQFNPATCVFTSAHKLNDGSDPNKFINQPYGEAQQFASLTDSL